jgi:hypothetical protein
VTVLHPLLHMLWHLLLQPLLPHCCRFAAVRFAHAVVAIVGPVSNTLLHPLWQPCSTLCSTHCSSRCCTHYCNHCSTPCHHWTARITAPYVAPVVPHLFAIIHSMLCITFGIQRRYKKAKEVINTHNDFHRYQCNTYRCNMQQLIK